MEATSTSTGMGRDAALMEETGQSLRMPSMEPHSGGPSEIEAGASAGNPNHSVLAVCDMVSNSTSDGSGSTNASSSISSPPSTRERTSYLGQKRTLEPLSLETKRTQQAFLEWLKAGSFEKDINPAIPIINWLHHIMATQKLAWSTILVKKTAVLALFSNAEDIKSDPSYQSLLRAGSSSVVVDTKHGDYDISRVVEYFRQLPLNMDMSMSDLARKLCWLLGVCGFMRPDDIYCTDVARSRVIRDRLELAVVFPKEKRGRQRIIKYVHISRHPGPTVCPVQACLAYRSRTFAMDLPTPHPKDPLCKITPLIRYLKDQHKPVVATTISVFMDSISRRMVPKGKKSPKLRALGSTLAALAGVLVAGIMVQGNWSSPKIFEKHYR
ncbi:hypothetical protein BG011_002522, partial [Mortierella polycephala]